MAVGALDTGSCFACAAFPLSPFNTPGPNLVLFCDLSTSSLCLPPRHLSLIVPIPVLRSSPSTFPSLGLPSFTLSACNRASCRVSKLRSIRVLPLQCEPSQALPRCFACFPRGS